MEAPGGRDLHCCAPCALASKRALTTRSHPTLPSDAAVCVRCMCACVCISCACAYENDPLFVNGAGTGDGSPKGSKRSKNTLALAENENESGVAGGMFGGGSPNAKSQDILNLSGLP